jgi:glucose/arabinose dehydrogenase
VRFSLLLVLISVACNSQTPKGKTEATQSSVTYETLLKREDVIWGFDFLDDGQVILTERSGRMLLFNPSTKKVQVLKGLPKIYNAGQAGLLDVRVHPDFKNTKQIYFSYSEPVGKSESTTALGVATLQGSKLVNFKKLFTGHAANSNDIHYGSRIEFDDKGHLYVSMGDRDERNKAQNLGFHQGKVLRLNLDGSVPQDNPFISNKEAKAEIYSLGHRNPQGLTRHPETHELWEAEMGPRGGDEVNLIAAGKNYGWPVITYGKEYYGPRIGDTAKAGLEQPVTYWVPSISPSALAFYSGDKFPEWKNNLFLATLSGNHIHRVVLNGTKIDSQEELLGKLEYRWRSVRTGPDGYLYLGTDEGRFGRLIKK